MRLDVDPFLNLSVEVLEFSENNCPLRLGSFVATRQREMEKLNEFRPYGMTNPPSTGTVIPVT